MKKNFILLLILSLILSVFTGPYNYRIINLLTQEGAGVLHIGVLTLNIMILGIMLISLILLISVYDQEKIKKLGGTSISENLRKRLVTGLSFSIASIFISLIFLIDIDKFLYLLDRLFELLNTNLRLYRFFANTLAIFGLFSMVLSFVFLALAIKALSSASISLNKTSEEDAQA